MLIIEAADTHTNRIILPIRSHQGIVSKHVVHRFVTHYIVNYKHLPFMNQLNHNGCLTE